MINLRKDCIASRDDLYRYWLSRDIDPLPGVVNPYSGVLWIMLNPSTARGANVNDPTQRRCVSFSAAFGARRMGIINLFARSSAKPEVLFDQGYDAAVGGDIQHAVWEEAVHMAKRWNWITICAWGKPSLGKDKDFFVHLRASSVLQWWNRPSLAGPGLVCLGLTADNWPRHPLYLPSVSSRIPFDPSAMRN